MRARVLALGLSAAMLGSAGLFAANRSEGSSAATSRGSQSLGGGTATSSVAVTRQDLVARMEVDGTLGYAGEMRV